jgi:hypothetical protein
MAYQRLKHSFGLLFVLTAYAVGLGAASAPATDEPADWWSLKPIRKPAPPLVQRTQDASWVRTPIDRFILAKLHEKGLRPSKPADRRTLLRRVTFDLIGLPPTSAEIEAFLADPAENAYEKVVDRLLASPQYGERWARHWMDVVHYAETHGHDQDRPRPNAWPYRDYLIRAFNEDRPYVRFVQEQIAGDVLFPGDPQGIVATGLLATGPWDESSLQSIMDDTSDKRIAQYLDRDDMLSTVMSTFISATVHCARCHDHKFDPITQKDYYALQAVFAGVDKADRPYDADRGVARRRRELMSEKARLEALRDVADATLLSPAAEAAVADWEKRVQAASASWSPLDPVTYVSAQGATLTKLPDGSLCSGGKRPDKDTVTIIAHTDLQNITGVRLEVLTDPSLPHQGPGRQDNGNLHLSEFRVKTAPKNLQGTAKPIVLHKAAADFDQDGWTIAHAIDGNPRTAWGIYPQVGKSHQAVFEMKEPVGFPGGTTLTFDLEQNHGGGHLIGRIRLSVTTRPRPASSTPQTLPDEVRKALAMPPAERTALQKATLAQYVLAQQVGEQLAALPPPSLVYAAASDFKPDGNFRPAKSPRPIHVLYRGDISKPRQEATPGALACVPELQHHFRPSDPKNEGSRRAALARWITDPKNVLTWRSIVNRVWHHHFGRGIVATPNDLGHLGATPTHPELLDWLAADFQESGGSLKRLHRLIVTSAVYRQSSRHEPSFAAIDADNHYLWRMNRMRLDAESVRDAVLRATGKLDLTMGGPSVKQFIQTPGIHVTPNVDYLNFDVDRPENYRRSVYRFVFRTLPDPFLDTLDCPDSSQLTPARNTSVSPLQALAMLNNRFMVRQSEHLAECAAKAGKDLPAQIRCMYLRVLGREPTSKEGRALAEYAGKHGLANACRILFNSNEFLFVD